MGQKFAASLSGITGTDNMHLSRGNRKSGMSTSEGVKTGMSYVAYVSGLYNVYIKELRHMHRTVLFLSYVDDILFVANSIDEVKQVWA